MIDASVGCTSLLSVSAVAMPHIAMASTNTPSLAATPALARTEHNAKTLVWLATLLILLGAAARLSPLVDWQDRLPWQYMTEDGYLMQTVARNMAVGLGMSSAQGTIETNGVQPLATFVFAALHWLAGGDKTVGLVLVTLVSAVIAAVAASLMFLLLRRLFAQLKYADALALFSSAVWFAAPLIVRHSMNGLETGLYHAGILAVLLLYTRWLQGDGNDTSWSWSRRIAFGVVLGMVFLARNDAVFLIGALLTAHALVGLRSSPHPSNRARVADAVTAGAVSLVVALPWLANNYLKFGSIVPISGAAQARTSTGLGSNLPLVPANLYENAIPFLPLPGSVETNPAVMAACLVLVGVILWLWWLRLARPTLVGRRIFAAWLLSLVALVAYYGVLFGAPWFLPRYLSPLSLLLWPAAAAVTASMLISRWPRALDGGAALVVLLCTAFAFQQYRDGARHMHRQQVEWTRNNVSPAQWIGAPQTGALGYFHDRTINFDGKVNPYASQAHLRDGHVLNYVMSTPVDFIVDWAAVADWMEHAQAQRFAQAFEVRVRDPERNLAVLARKLPVTQRAP